MLPWLCLVSKDVFSLCSQPFAPKLMHLTHQRNGTEIFDKLGAGILGDQQHNHFSPSRRTEVFISIGSNVREVLGKFMVEEGKVFRSLMGMPSWPDDFRGLRSLTRSRSSFAPQRRGERWIEQLRAGFQLGIQDPRPS